jgi:hypothetical protein
VRQLAALGPAGGATGVDQRGQAVGGERLAAGLELAVGHVLARLCELVDGTVVDHVDRLQVGRLIADRLDGRGVLVTLDDDRRRARVRQDPGDLVGAGGLVDRDRDRAGGPDREVDDGPLEAGLRLQGDPVARGDTGSDQSLGDPGDLVTELLPGDVLPLAVPLDAEPGLVAYFGDVLRQQIGERLVGADLGGSGNAELAHAWSSPPRRPEAPSPTAPARDVSTNLAAMPTRE